MVSSLAWFEEWFLHFEWKYVHTYRREIYLEHVWDLKGNRTTLNTIKDFKLAINISALLSWSRFATYKEDEALRDKKKWES